MEFYIRGLLIFLSGTMLGSFFYTLALRFADGSFDRDVFKALVSPSKCPSCEKRISPLYLVPIIGFLIRRGKCQACGAAISPAYPVFEIIYGLLALAVASRHGLSAYSVILYLIIGVSLCISIVDFKIFVIPNSLVIVFFLLSIYPVVLNNSIKENLLGLALAFSFFVIILLVFPGSFGGGDIKLSAAAGFFLGLELTIVAIEISLVLGSIIGIIYALKSKKGLRIKIPFAPFLTAGLIIAIIYGNDILLTYFRVIY